RSHERAANRAGRCRAVAGDIEHVPRAVVVEQAPQPFHVDLILAVEAVVEVPAYAVAGAVVPVVALAPIVRRRNRSVVHAPTRFHIFNGPIVLIGGPADEEAELAVVAEAAAVGETALVGVAAGNADLPILAGHIPARGSFRRLGDEIHRATDRVGV